MRFVVFGLTVSSSWGNGHATLWRGLCRALSERGHTVRFFERDVSYYAAHRDTAGPAGCDLRLYNDWEEVRREAQASADAADVAMITSFCPDADAAADVVVESRASLKAFYDMDTGVTLDGLARREPPAYIPRGGLRAFDLVLSYTGGRALDDLRTQLGARVVAPLYGSVDPEIHRPVEPDPARACRLSYLGTYASDRQEILDRLFLAPARERPDAKFVLAGSQYPADFPWGSNVFYLSHLPPGDHARFYSSSDWTLNVTRGPMAALGYCPSGRLFEAAACAAPIVSDWWEGLETFFEPDEEIVIARDTEDVLAALDMDDRRRREMGRRARERALDCHTAAARVRELEALIERAGAQKHAAAATAGVREMSGATGV